MTRILLDSTAEDLHTTSTTSQKLAEGAYRSAEVRKEPFILPDCVRGFESVFAKEDFDILPEYRQWDHAIELILGSEPKSLKVYSLSPVEQKELDSFLKELLLLCIHLLLHLPRLCSPHRLIFCFSLCFICIKGFASCLCPSTERT